MKIMKPIHGILTGLFMAAALAAPAAATEYTVVEARAPQSYLSYVPDRELPAPGPGRQAAERWVKQIPVFVETYSVLLRDDAGAYAQCAGFRVSPESPDEAKMLDYLSFEPLATSLPLLRLMHAEPKTPAWPVRLGGCTAMNLPDIRNKGRHMIQVRLGPDIVLDHMMLVYGTETDEQRLVRKEREISGGIGTKGNSVFRCASAGWRGDLRTVQQGDRVKLPGLCPN